MEPQLVVYLDDVVIVSYFCFFSDVFRPLHEVNITVSKDNCKFCRTQMKYLRFVVDRNSLHVDPDKVNAMLETPFRNTVSDVRRIVEKVFRGIDDFYLVFLRSSF